MSLTEEEREKFDRSFDKENVNFSGIEMQNRFFIQATLNYMNDLLRVQGFVTVNDAYRSLGFPLTEESRSAGWTGETYVSFGDLVKDGSAIPLSFNINTLNVHKEIVK